MANLDVPASVLARVERSPIEDIVLYILRRELPDLPTFTLFPEDPPNSFVVVRGEHSLNRGGDERFTAHYEFSVNAVARDPDGDEKAALISDAIRTVLRDAWMSDYHIPHRGWVKRCELLEVPARESDWATSSGPIQYADLPTAVWRYESVYSLLIRRDFNTPLNFS